MNQSPIHWESQAGLTHSIKHNGLSVLSKLTYRPRISEAETREQVLEFTPIRPKRKHFTPYANNMHFLTLVLAAKRSGSPQKTSYSSFKHWICKHCLSKKQTQSQSKTSGAKPLQSLDRHPVLPSLPGRRPREGQERPQQPPYLMKLNLWTAGRGH